jgi:hypothetical protein
LFSFSTTGNNRLLSLIPFYQPILSSNWVWRELVRRDLASKNKEAGIQEMRRWTAELSAKAAADTACGGRCSSDFVTAAAVPAACPYAASATSAVALGLTPSALAADPDTGRECAWKNLYVKL